MDPNHTMPKTHIPFTQVTTVKMQKPFSDIQLRQDRAREVAQCHAINLLAAMLPIKMEQIAPVLTALDEVADALLPFLLGEDKP